MQNLPTEAVIEDLTVNIKRTTLVTVFLVSLAILAGTSFVALYAAYKAMSAASNVDEQWQQQHDRILRIEASAVKASADADEVRTDQARIDRAMNDLNKRMTEVSQVARQVTTYQGALDAMEAKKAEGMKKVADERAEALSAAEAAEKQGAENFDKLLAYRLQQHWQRPPAAVAGGKADILVQFANDGTITNALVATSSGNPEVDDSIIKAASDLAKIPEMSSVAPNIYVKYLQQRRISFHM